MTENFSPPMCSCAWKTKVDFSSITRCKVHWKNWHYLAHTYAIHTCFKTQCPLFHWQINYIKKVLGHYKAVIKSYIIFIRLSQSLLIFKKKILKNPWIRKDSSKFALSYLRAFLSLTIHFFQRLKQWKQIIHVDTFQAISLSHVKEIPISQKIVTAIDKYSWLIIQNNVTVVNSSKEFPVFDSL